MVGGLLKPAFTPRIHLTPRNPCIDVYQAFASPVNVKVRYTSLTIDDGNDASNK
jgi:hypothetical protein